MKLNPKQLVGGIVAIVAILCGTAIYITTRSDVGMVVAGGGIFVAILVVIDF